MKISSLTQRLRDELMDENTCPSFMINVNPVPASRPRVTRWGVYYSKPYKKWFDAARESITKAEKIFTGKLVVLVEVYGKQPKKTDRTYPVGDVDNHAKGPLDLLTQEGNIWKDDDQVVALWVTKQYAEEPGRERTQVTVYELRD